jgi:hypothetical protein
MPVDKPAAVAIEEPTAKPSRKREVTAVVTTTVISVALGVLANNLIDRATQRVHKQINPKKFETEE